MNFFKLYIGDYQRDTAHLSIAEHGAFLLMLQHYYATEKPLPAGRALHRMLRAQDKFERDAIDVVVAQFWRTTDAGLVNDRADVELAEAAPRILAAKVNGKKGGKKPKRNPLGNPLGSGGGTESQSSPEPEPEPEPDNFVEREGSNSPAVTAGAAVCRALKQAGIPPDKLNPSHPGLRALLDAGATVDEFVAAASKASGKADPFPYILGVVRGQRRDAAQGAGELHRGPLPTASVTVQSDAADRTTEYMRRQFRELTAEEKAAADEARQRAMAAITVMKGIV